MDTRETLEADKVKEEAPPTAEQELVEFSEKFPELGKILAKAAKYFR
jgi:hypothetical protein